MRILVTGAAGFLGRATVAAALADGHEVLALTRAMSRYWAGNPRVTELTCDLAGSDARPFLEDIFQEGDAVIHCVAAKPGSDFRHAQDTIFPTEAVTTWAARLADQGHKLRLVLVSSIAVYGYAGLPEGAVLDETTALEPSPERRDAYCRAKLAQEAVVMRAAQAHPLTVRIARPGVIFGKGRIWTSRLGLLFGGVALCIGGNATVPLTHVTHTAQALVRAATGPLARSDLPLGQGAGYLDVINIVQDAPPSQLRYLDSLRRSRRVWFVLRLPLRVLALAATGAWFAGMLLPGLMRWLPGLLRTEALDARLKPLRYSNARLHDRLGYISALTLQEGINE
ncbi:MAG: NAD-dependent epimerase/dehydratase family protein [Paracoccaceae bacterium]